MKESSFGRRLAAPLMVCAVLAACGDASTPDTRGYTKAPLEDPGVFVRSEETTEMDRLGDPNVREPVVIMPGDTAAAGAAASGQAGS